MTKTKLEIIGPYTPEYEGPFCTRQGEPVRLVTKTEGSKTHPVIGMMGNKRAPYCCRLDGRMSTVIEKSAFDLMNAREVPVVREFWINEYRDGGMYYYKTQEEAYDIGKGHGFVRTIHVREVLPGDGE